MLPAAHRLRSSADFSAVTRQGRRARVGATVVYLLPGGNGPARFGLIVSKAVGGSVVRHRVSRQLRAQLSLRLEEFPAGSRTVVRALPDCARASSAELGHNLDRALAKLTKSAVPAGKTSS